MTLKILSILMVLIGAAVLFLSFSPAIKICRNLIGRVRRKWVIILYLMGFFILGYLSFDFILISNLPFPLELVTGGVFLGGAVFVFIVMNVSLSTIAALQKAEEAIHVAKSDWESTFDTVTDMITVHDMDFNIIRANPAARALFGLQQHEGLSLKKCFRCYHGTEKPPSGCASCQSLQTGKPSVFEVFEPHLNKYIEIRAMPRFGNDGRLVGLIHVVRDITERKLTEKENKSLAEHLNRAEKMEALGLLAGGIAHDFNNILSAIIGYTELAQMKIEAEAEIQSYLAEVLTAGNRAKDLINQILAFSRHAESEKKPVQIRLVVKEALKLLRASLPSNIEIHENILSTSLVLCDPTQIHQIVMNICINAAHAMRDAGGILEINLSDFALDSALASTYPEVHPRPHIRLSIHDTGHGMTPEVKSRIFDPFFTTKDKDEGTGLGLSVVHGIVKDCGGAIDVYSEPDHGTTFTLYFPAIQRNIDDKPLKYRILPTGTEHILCVDDEKSIVDILMQMLPTLGYTVEVRTSSIEALALFKTKPHKFDLVITDMTMPQMTGDVLARELIKIRSDIPVILCTGFSEKITKETAEAMGIKAFLMKPLIRDEMAHTIRRVLDGVKPL